MWLWFVETCYHLKVDSEKNIETSRKISKSLSSDLCNQVLK